VIVEDAEHELKLFAVDATGAGASMATACTPSIPCGARMFATSALLRSITARRAAMGNVEHGAGRVRVG
jgi:hypothetical protein